MTLQRNLFDPFQTHLRILMRKLSSIVVGTTLASAAFISVGAFAQPASASASNGEIKTSPTASDMTDGEVRKIDLENKKITLKHGEIKNLGMPGMTMVFQVKDPVMLDTVKAGDKVRFNVEKAGGALVVTRIETAN